ncbi:hypothetical protein AB0K00_19205 [Dactylosporangium sp. NPDC049525]|uniref:hypothetical protein n=1 Tax=Dactylosporangium sp. NPDC049525 TaxID=3154730 RepID=UPI003440C13B
MWAIAGRGAAGLGVLAVAPVAVVFLARSSLGGAWFTVAAVAVCVAGFLLVAAVITTLFGEDPGGRMDRWATAALILAFATPVLVSTGIRAEEVRAWQWTDVTVQQVRCARTTDDGGCVEEYRISDTRTEADLGWSSCGDTRFQVGSPARAHVNPADTRVRLGSCGYTSGWYAPIFWTIVTLHTLVAVAVLRRSAADLATHARTRAA